MSTDAGWPRHPTWGQPSPPPWSGYGPPGHQMPHDLPERVRAVEEIVRHVRETTTERLAAQVGRLEGQDRRLEAGDTRMDGLQARIKDAEDQAGKVLPLEVRVSAIEKRWDVLKYTIAGALLAATATGNMTFEQAIKVLRLASGAP